MDERTTELALRAFEWGAQKSESNRAFYEPILLRSSNRNNEERWIAIGTLDERFIAVVFTRRKDVIRIISARRATKNEERAYHNAKLGRPTEG